MEERDVTLLRESTERYVVCWSVSEKCARTFSELKTAIRSETETTSTETVTKDVNSFALRLHEVCDLPGHHMEHILVEESDFPSA
jgi:hypothetical protein